MSKHSIYCDIMNHGETCTCGADVAPPPPALGSAPKRVEIRYCTDRETCEYSDCPTAFCDLQKEDQGQPVFKTAEEYEEFKEWWQQHVTQRLEDKDREIAALLEEMEWLDRHCAFVADSQYKLGPYKVGELRLLAQAGLAADKQNTSTQVTAPMPDTE